MKLSALAGLALSLISGCGTTILQQRLETRADGFTLVLTEVTDGPNEYRTPGTRLVPGDGLRFLWFSITLRNDQNAKQTFNYDRCGLDYRDNEILPGVIIRSKLTHSLVDDKQEDLAPNEPVERELPLGVGIGRTCTTSAAT